MVSKSNVKRSSSSRKWPQRKQSSVIKRATPYARKSYSNATRVIAAPSVGLGQGARTVLKTTNVAVLLSPSTGLYPFNVNVGSCSGPGGYPLGALGGATQEPNLYDQWSLIYSRYVVEKAWLKLEFSASGLNTGGINSATVVAAYPTITGQQCAKYLDAASQDFSKSVLLGPTDVTSTNTMTFKLDHAKVLGRKGPVTAEDNGAATSSTPATGSSMWITGILFNPQAAVYSWTVRATLYQTVYFDKRRSVNESP